MKLEYLFVLILAILLGSGNVNGKIKRGEITSESNFHFLDTFHFSNSEESVLEYEIKYPADQCCYRLVIFDESYGQWGAIRPNEDRLTCRNMIDRVTDLDYKIKLFDRDPACHTETDNAGLNWLVCHDRINFASRQRPQSYFVHLTNCRSNRKGLRNVSYSLHMTNEQHGLWKEFGDNQIHMMETDLAFFLGYVVMTILATRFRYVLSQKRLLHLTYRLFYGSLFLKTICLLLLNIELSRFAKTGLEMTAVLDAAEVLSCLSSIIFVSVLLLVSKGFSITRARASLFGTVKMIVFDLMYAASYTLVFFDQRVLIDPRNIITSMTSLSASGVIAVKIVGCMIFVYGSFFTIKNNPGKALFYVPFTIFFSLWFMAEPTYRFLAFYAYPVLRSTNIWNGIDMAMCFAGHVYFLYITRPGSVNKHFPFHLRSTKISFRDGDDDEGEDEERPYRPSEDFYSIFHTGKKPSGTDAILTIPDDPEHFQTPVFSFDADLDAISTVEQTVSGSVTKSYTTQQHGGNMSNAPCTGFAVMPHVAQPKIRPQINPLPTLSQIPRKDRDAVGVCTVAVPRGGFAIFSAQKQQERPVAPSFLPPIKPSNGSLVLPPIKTIKGPGTAVQVTKAPLVTGRSTDESLQTKVSKESVSSVNVPETKNTTTGIQKVHLNNNRPVGELLKTKASAESLSTVKVPETGNPTTGIQKLHQVTVRPIDEPLKTKASAGSLSTVKVTETGNQTTGIQKVHQITVRPIDVPLETKASVDYLSTVKVPETGNQTTRIEKVHQILVTPVNEPLKTKASAGSLSTVKVPKTENPTTGIQKVRQASGVQDRQLAADGGDYVKSAKKTQKEPSIRRFAKPSKPALCPEVTPTDESQKALSPKTKKKRLRRFLRLARKKNKLSKAD